MKRLSALLLTIPLLACLLLAPPVVAQAPDAKAPDAKAPDAKAPDAKAPDAKAPDAKAPDAKAPETPTEAKTAPEETPAKLELNAGDTAWMLTSTALAMFMVPGLALFYGGMVRRKNVLATMMQSMICLAVVGVYWIAIGYCLAFGESQGGWIGWSPKLLFLRGVEPGDILPNSGIPIYLHVMYQGMFAIITPALISGAIAERIRFGPYCLFVILWVTLVYCPLAHWVWAMNWWDTTSAGVVSEAAGKSAVGFLGKMNALDFAGGTVVHISAGLSGLACILVLRKRLGYPEHAFHPNSMVLTLLGAGMLWFGWFGFNGGSAGGSNALAVSAFGATQAAAAAAALSWVVAEWLHKGKPTALGWASGVVAGLVAVTPAAGYVYVWGGLAIGLIAGVLCYGSVCLKPKLGYDDSLDAFGVHGVGGFLGAALTGVFCFTKVNSAMVPEQQGVLETGGASLVQLIVQLKAAGISVAVALVVTLVLAKVVDDMFGLITDAKSETDGLDRAEHGEVGFDLGLALESVASVDHQPHEPRSAAVPPNGHKGFSVVVDGVNTADLMDTWSKLCQTGEGPPSPEFKAVYPYMTLVEGNRFFFRGGDPATISQSMLSLFQKRLKQTGIQTHVE